MKIRTLPSADRLRELFEYFPSTGTLCWKRRSVTDFQNNRICNSWNARCAGKEVTYINPSNGYIFAKLEGSLWAAHRIIWKMMTGDDPEYEVDHRDLDRTNNRWENLRSSTRLQNQANRPKRSTNTSGYKGVTRDRSRSKWQACINFDGHHEFLGRFSDKEDAASAYALAAKKYHGEFMRLR